MSESTQTYFEQRMELLGVTTETNVVQLLKFDAATDKNVLTPIPIFTQSEKGIDIAVYSIDRMQILYKKGDSRWKNKPYKITRLETPLVKANGDTLKYLMPKGEATVPFFPPSLLDAYENKTPINTLYMTEGYFKAFKGHLAGMMIVGLPSITCMKDRETGAIHKDIKDLIGRCNIQRVVWLVDGDCLNITTKEITENVDLAKRPKQFFNTVNTFSELLSKIETLKLYFAHVNSDNLEGKPKGLDDMLCAFPDDVPSIIDESNTFDKVQGGKYEGNYFVKFDVTYSVGKIYKYFMLNDVDTFYQHHVEKRPELKLKDFTFFGTIYTYNEKDAKCIIKIPSDANRYFRVGDIYHEYIEVPDADNRITKTFHIRQKSTIKDDNPAKDFFNHIPKYKAFCIVPDHFSYQRVINNCFNMYAPFEHEMEDGDCELSLNMVKHIFGEDEVSYTDKDGKVRTMNYYELGLDYLSILLKTPQQILPILCLVSNERQTGKTTFKDWIECLFGENMITVGNADLENNFNRHWTNKLIIAVDETKIDKLKVMEKVKSLSTSRKIIMEGKGANQENMQFFGKFMFLSNNEDSFISVDSEEIRFWVLKIKRFPGKLNVDMLQELKDEIPAFLAFINKRKLATDFKERHWFDTSLLRTAALTKLVQNSLPSIVKEIKAKLEQMFIEFDLARITMPYRVIKEELLKNKYDDNYLRKIIKEQGWVLQATQRLTYPRMIESKNSDGSIEYRAIPIAFNTRYYEFNRSDFTTIPMEKEADFSADANQENELF